MHSFLQSNSFFANLRTSRVFLVGLLWVFGVVSSPRLTAQLLTYPYEGGLPKIKAYTPSEYGAAARNVDIQQDHRGFMYFGNEEGVLEFDGTSWTLIPTTNGSRPTSLCLDDCTVREDPTRPLNRVYVGAVGEIGYLKPNPLGKMEYVSLVEKVPEKNRNFGVVWQTHAVKEGIAFQSNKSVFLYQGDSIRVFEPDSTAGNFGFHYSFDVLDELWVREWEKGPHRLRNGVFEPVPGGEVLAGERVFGVFPRSTGDFLIHTTKLGFFIWDGEQFTPWQNEVSDYLLENDPYLGIPLPDDMYLFTTTKGGLTFMDREGRLVFQLGESEGLPSGACYGMFSDRAGNVWVTHEKGIHYIQLNSSFSFFDEKMGLGDYVTEYGYHNGNLYCGAVSGGYIRKWPAAGGKLGPDWKFDHDPAFQENTFHISSLKDALFYGTVTRLLLVRDQPEQVETIMGVKSSDNRRIHHLRAIQGYPNHILGIGSDGLFLLENLNPGQSGQEKWRYRWSFKAYKEVSDYLEQDRSGYFWANNPGGGVIRFKLSEKLDGLESKEIFTPETGFLGSSSNNKVVLLDSQAVFISDSGLFRFQSDQHRIIPDSNFNALLKENRAISSLVQQQDGSIWVWANDPAKTRTESPPLLHQFIPTDQGYDVRTHHVRKIQSSFTEKVNLNIFPLPDGKVLFSTFKGFILYDPSIPADYDRPFRALIRQVDLTKPETTELYAGTSMDSQGVPSIPEGLQHDTPIPFASNSIRFTFSGLFFEDAEKTQFQYFLEGYEKDWATTWTSKNQERYDNLPHGEYTFHVRAQNVHGKVSEEATYSFRILRPWYLTGVAIFGYIVIAVVLIWGIVKLNTRRLRLQKENLEITVQERTEEIATQAQQLQEQNEKLVELDQFKQGMTSMIVHDLKNPLNSILSRTHAPPSEKETQYIRQSGSQMLNMVMNILDVGKFEDTRMELDLTPCSLMKMVLFAWNQVAFLAKEKEIKKITEIPATAQTLADKDILKRVLENLLTNAIKYSPVNSTIHIRLTQGEEGFHRLEVVDQGTGIPADKLGTVFEKFGQVAARKSGSVRSTGLGLTFCKLAIEAHGGEIGVESEIGVGSTFWFTVPETKEASPEERRGVEELAKSSEPSLELSPEEETRLEAVVKELKVVPIYRISLIRSVLKELEGESEGILEWREQVLTAANTGNMEKYGLLLNLS